MTAANMTTKNLDMMTAAQAGALMGLAVGRVVRIMGGEVQATTAEISELVALVKALDAKRPKQG